MVEPVTTESDILDMVELAVAPVAESMPNCVGSGGGVATDSDVLDMVELVVAPVAESMPNCVGSGGAYHV
jgi:hypothetical protein